MSTDYRWLDGSCVGCGQGTDTALGFRGEAEWHMAGLGHLGVPEEQASLMISRYTDNPPGMVPDGVFEVVFQVCATCVERAKPNFPRPTLATPFNTVPVVEQMIFRR